MPPDEPGAQGASLPPEVRAIVAQIPAWSGARDLRATPLTGAASLNNTNYLVEVGGERAVLRIAAPTAHQIGVRRDHEIAAIQAAAQAGIAPALSYADAQGNLVSAYIDGRHWEAEEFHDRANLARLCATLRRLHAIRGVPADGSAERRIARLLASAAALGVELPSATAAHTTRLRAISEERARDRRFQPGLTHGDLWGNNFLDDGRQLWLVDWEFAGDGDTLFDLATISLAGRSTPDQQRQLLQEYGYTEPGDLRQLRMLHFVVFFFEAAWALVQHGRVGSAGYDYWAHATRMLDRLGGWEP